MQGCFSKFSIEKLKQIVRKLKSNAEQRSSLGILTFSEKILSSWDLYIDSLDELKEYVNLLKAEDYESAEIQYTVYSKAYTKAINAGQEESLTSSLNEIDKWYQDNIGICLDIFEQYS